MKRVIGIGGIFFKSKDPDTTKTWYARHLGLDVDQYGAMFKSRKLEAPNEISYLQWSVMKSDSDHFKPSDAQFMINYRVEDLEWLVEELRKEGVTICDTIENYDYGKFVHIMDPDGNKIELWEPVDAVFDEFYNEKNK